MLYTAVDNKEIQEDSPRMNINIVLTRMYTKIIAQIVTQSIQKDEFGAITQKIHSCFVWPADFY